jgi:hypothetical protein
MKARIVLISVAGIAGSGTRHDRSRQESVRRCVAKPPEVSSACVWFIATGFEPTLGGAVASTRVCRERLRPFSRPAARKDRENGAFGGWRLKEGLPINCEFGRVADRGDADRRWAR